jgi:hypothetical protein
MVVSAEKARQKAEARRLRILAKANERLDVVSGLVPSNEIDDKLNSEAAPGSVSADSPSASNRADASPAVDSRATNLSVSPAGADEKENKGSRRMAAMRRRRVQQRAVKEEEKALEEKVGDGVDKSVIEAKKSEESKIAAGDESVTETKVDATTDDSNVDDKDATSGVDDAAATVEDSKTTITEPTKQSEARAPPTKDTHPSSTPPKEEPKKSYKGVAKMRRQMLKQQKAARLQSITDSEALHVDDHLERELAAEMAAMGVTAKMVREGVDVVDASPLSGSGVGVGSFKNRSRGWLAMLLPPINTFSRLVTLLVLFGVGFRIGLETHSVSGGVERSLVSGRGSIHHVESSLTKPWEYGMGGKVAYMVGMMPTSPPTALPTGFNQDSSCIADYGEAECKSTEQKKQKKNDKHVDHKLHLVDMEDEFDSGRAKPRGVGVGATSEFDDDNLHIKTPNIDPLFRVDLDDLLSKTSLPFPIDHAARFAIGFHRTWVYYLWSLPLSVVKTITSTPKNLLSGWIRYPPVILMFTLLVRMGNRLLLGSGNKLEEDKKAKGKGGFDVMTKVMETAKSYVESNFPWLVFILGTLLEVVKVDMYVVFCGLLVGLVMPLRDIGLNLGTWIGSGEVLGDGEL